MNEYKIAYNPFTKEYFSGCTSHCVQFWNKKLPLVKFDDYIRGIILGDVLYLRVYYPFSDLSDLCHDNKLYHASLKLLKENTNAILTLIKDKENITIAKIKYNVTNDLLSGLKLTCI